MQGSSEERRLRREAKAKAIIQTIRNPKWYTGPRENLKIRITAAQRRATLLARKDLDTSHQVYFVYCAGRIKIGTTTDSYKRSSGLSTGTPNPTCTIYSMPGGKVTEYALHCRFENHRLHGEWFEFCPSLREFILEYGGKRTMDILESVELEHREWVIAESKFLGISFSHALPERQKVEYNQSCDCNAGFYTQRLSP